MFAGAIFDMDGTIIDSMGVWKRITGEFMKERRLDISAGEIASFRDMTMDESMPFIKERFNLPDSVEELKAEFERLGYDEYMFRVPPKPYIKEYIEMLKKKGVKIAIATSGYRELCEGAMRRLGMYEYIDAYAFSFEVGVNKSKPDVYLLAAKRLGVEPEKCMVFEDILAGILGAKKGGMMTTAVYDESSHDEWDKIKLTADRAIMSWSELLTEK